MAFDLGRAMRAKEERESARLMDFAFRRRARATRMLAAALGLEDGAALVALGDEAATLDRIAATTGLDRATLHTLYVEQLAKAEAALRAERGDPTPHRLG